MSQNETDPDTLADSGSGPEHDLAVAVSHLPDPHSVEFTMKIRGGAYDRLEVDNFMRDLATAIGEVKAAAAATRQELAELRAQKTTQSASGPDSDDEITAGAVGLLTQAQLIADKAVADAEQYARDLVLTARSQYREILERAESTASQAATATIPAEHIPPVPEIEYVRTYAQVAQIQLRSVLEALTEQVDRLGSLPQPSGDTAASPADADAATDEDEGPTGEPDWAPSASGSAAAESH